MLTRRVCKPWLGGIKYFLYRIWNNKPYWWFFYF